MGRVKDRLWPGPDPVEQLERTEPAFDPDADEPDPRDADRLDVRTELEIAWTRIKGDR